MNSDQPGLFDDPTPVPAGRRQPGRIRQMWRLTARAEVTVTDEEALFEAFERSRALGYSIGSAEQKVFRAKQSLDLAAGPLGGEDRDEPKDALAWLIWPTDGMEGLIEAGAFICWGADSVVEALHDQRCSVTWTVTVKLTNVEKVRESAVSARPDAAADIAGSFATAWLSAVDPYEPLRSIPGITWQAESAVVEHVPAKPRRPV
jgi:hypothetical protein